MNLLIFFDIENCVSKYLRTYSSYMMVGPGGRFTKKSLNYDTHSGHLLPL